MTTPPNGALSPPKALVWGLAKIRVERRCPWMITSTRLAARPSPVELIQNLVQILYLYIKFHDSQLKNNHHAEIIISNHPDIRQINIVCSSQPTGKAQAVLSNQTAAERNVTTCKKNLRLIADALQLVHNVIDGCYDLIKSMEDQGALKNRTNLVNMCAVVYIVCRDMPSVARSLREIAAGCVHLETKKLTVDQYARDIGRAMMKIRRNV